MFKNRYEEELYEFEKVKFRRLILALATISIATIFSLLTLVMSIINNGILRNSSRSDMIPYSYNTWEE